VARNPGKRTVILLACCLAALASAYILLGGDSTPFYLWWICTMILGILFFPITSKLFYSFCDAGWIFSKVLGIAVCGYVMFAFCRAGIMPFTGGFSLLCVIISAAAFLAVYYLVYVRPGKTTDKSVLSFDLILLEEFLFISVFLMWTYFTGFRPEALSTEKFMDYGFMAAMMRDTSLPAADIWHASDPINYYYGGQYYAVFLTKLTGTRVNETYNIAKALVAAFAFVIPFNLGLHLSEGIRKKKGRFTLFGTAAGLVTGTAVSLAGNVHYILYGLFGNLFRLSGYEDYWFPSSTRYIGHNPETADSCIHEFPSYSFVLGDLHAHVVNIMFVLLFIGLVYAWFRSRETDRKVERAAAAGVPELLKEAIADPYIWLMTFLIGVFQWTNYWDFVIYLTVAVISFALYAIRQNRRSAIEAAVVFMFRFLFVFMVQFVAAAPFTTSFVTMQSGIAKCIYHSAFYQLAILWGLPVVSIVLLFIYVVRYVSQNSRNPVDTAGTDTCQAQETVSVRRRSPVKIFISDMKLSDMTGLLLGICGIGLILIPELIYVKDIYGDGFARANTMFKLTYQAYIMFGISMIYSFFRFISGAKSLVFRAAAAVLITVFALTCGYFPYSVKCWFGDVSDRDRYKGLDATAYLDTQIPSDAEAIHWLEKNVKGIHVVLEANGNSYTEYCRVSAMTGLPTAAGWYTHEWLWRNDTSELNSRIAEIEEIYTSADRERVCELIEKYRIEYIFVGKYEREKYPSINEMLLTSLGKIVYRGTNGDVPAYIIRTDLEKE